MSGGLALIPVIVVLALCAWFYDLALAAGAQSAETSGTSSQSEGRQSGPKGNAQPHPKAGQHD
jgi:hypothetical protein